MVFHIWIPHIIHQIDNYLWVFWCYWKCCYFFISNSNCPLLIHKKETDSCTTSYAVTFLYLIISSGKSSIVWNFLHRQSCHLNRHSCYLFLSNVYTFFLSFSCLLLQERTRSSNTSLNCSGEGSSLPCSFSL